MALALREEAAGMCRVAQRAAKKIGVPPSRLAGARILFRQPIAPRAAKSAATSLPVRQREEVQALLRRVPKALVAAVAENVMCQAVDSFWRKSAVKQKTAKLLKSGRNQAVRLPKEFHFEGKEVRIRRHGTGVLLEPMNIDTKKVFKEMDRIGGDPIFPNGREQPPMQERGDVEEGFFVLIRSENHFPTGTLSYPHEIFRLNAC